MLSEEYVDLNFIGMTILLVLAIVGILLFSAEIFVPGGVLGVLGFICIIISIVMAYQRFDIVGGSLFALSTLVFLVITIVVEVRLFKKSPLALNTTIDREESDVSTSKEIKQDLVGKTANALSNLAPAGLVAVDGVTYDAVSQDGLIRKGEDLKVVRQGKFRLFVRRC